MSETKICTRTGCGGLVVFDDADSYVVEKAGTLHACNDCHQLYPKTKGPLTGDNMAETPQGQPLHGANGQVWFEKGGKKEYYKIRKTGWGTIFTFP